MKLEIEVISENADGSANAMVHFDKEALELLVEEGIISILRQYIENKKDTKKRKKSLHKIGDL